MDSEPNPLQVGLLLAVILVFSLFIQIAKTAVLNISDARVKEAKQNGNKKAQWLLHCLEEEHFFTLSMNACLTFFAFAYMYIAALYFIPEMVAKYTPNLQTNNFGFLLFAAVSYLLMVLVRDFLGFYIGHHQFSQIAFRLVWLCQFCCFISKPIVLVLNFLSKIICKLFKIDTSLDEENLLEEEIKQLMEEGEESGFIEDIEREMINNVFDFNDIAASEVMTHRTEMKALDIDKYSFNEIIQIATEDGFSRIPVYKDTSDHIEGILYVKDLLKLLQNKNPTIQLKEFLREPLFVPETASCADLFSLLSERKMQLAVVVDEYGGTAGIITMEDILESIVGNIQDEYDDEEPDIITIDDFTFVVEGSDDLEEICQLVGITCDEEILEENFTVGGFITEQIGRIPEPGEDVKVTLNNALFIVEKVEDNRIAQVRIELN